MSNLSPAAVLYDPTGALFGVPNNTIATSLYDAFKTPIRATVSQELKVAQLYTFADLTSKYELDPRLWDSLTATGGTTTHVPSESALRCSVTGASGSSAILRTNTYYKYQSGYTQFISMSAICSDTGQVNQTRRWGYFDTDNGLFFQNAGTAVAIVERSNVSGAPVDTTYAQAAWNVDPLDGTGPSGVTLDVSKGNIYEIELQWFGVGTSRYWIDGILVHEVVHDNTLPTPYMRTGSLPIQLEVVNTGASSPGSLTMVCTRVAAQGQITDPYDWTYSVASPAARLVGTSEVPVLSIRPRSLINGIVNRTLIIPYNMGIQTDSYRIKFKVVSDPILTGASWVGVTNAAVEYDASATTYSGGDLIYEGYISTDGGNANVNLEQFFDVFGRLLRRAGFDGVGTNVADILTIVAINEAVGNTGVRANVTWSEIR